MQEEETQSGVFEYHPDEFGDILVNWEVDEYPQHERSRMWYILAGVAGIGLIVYAVITSNFLFAIIILMIAVIMLLSMFLKPEKIPVVITTTGIVVGDMYYDYQSIRDFSIVYDPPDVKLLYLDFFAFSHPLLSVSLEDVDPNIIRENLLPFCLENLKRNQEDLTDVMRRLYKL
jgi:hypothetical protein